MTSTLGLWRNLGTVMGVAVSSLIVQNALRLYLEDYVTGPNKYLVRSHLTSSPELTKYFLSDHQKSS
jgi:hypothetical protein